MIASFYTNASGQLTPTVNSPPGGRLSLRIQWSIVLKIAANPAGLGVGDPLCIFIHICTNKSVLPARLQASW